MYIDILMDTVLYLVIQSSGYSVLSVRTRFSESLIHSLCSPMYSHIFKAPKLVTV
eukprot:c42590_g1_i1 orf=138-302(+)